MWKRFVTWLYTRASLVGMRYIYGPWSRFYRWAFERKYKKMPTDLPWNTDKLLEFFKECTWTKDKWYMGWDVMSKPQRFYETKHGDCDEFATFAATAMSGLVKWVLSVTWWVPGARKKFHGHNVCLYPVMSTTKDGKTEITWWHISNWGRIGPYDTIYKVIESIPKRFYNKAIPCAWSLRPAKARNSKEKDLQFIFGGTFKHLQDKQGDIHG